ncbi:MAG: L-threonylcarbamoyladenylate synthase [Alphaproteobacteria bacterium]|nr:L-threonylcarbamoyladenylate synthase [Alphaproteobacteria bacterium]
MHELQVIDTAVHILLKGGVILCPTDSIIGLSCNAYNAEAVQNIFNIKNRPAHKNLIILVPEWSWIDSFTNNAYSWVKPFVLQQNHPTTIIYPLVSRLPDYLKASDGSIAIRCCQNALCNNMMEKLQAPIISTSANISSHPTPILLKDVSDNIKAQVDFIVPEAFHFGTNSPSSIYKIIENEQLQKIR